jgi:hypothetical protein
LRNMVEEQIEAHSGDPKRSQSSGPAPRAAGKTAARKQKPKTKKGRKSGVSQGALRPDVVLVERPKSAFEFRVEGSRRFGFPAQTVDSGFVSNIGCTRKSSRLMVARMVVLSLQVQ